MSRSAKRRSVAIGAGRLPALLAAACWLLAGCSPAPTKPAADKPDAPQARPTPRPDVSPAKGTAGSDRKPPAAAEVKLTVVDKAGYDRFLREHRGKVMLVDFWATWCPSCVALLPHNVELEKRFADRGLVVATVSMDELDDPDDPKQQAPVREVLAAKAATLENLIARPAQPGKPDTDPFKAFAIPGGSLPHLKLYDPDGKLVRTFDSKANVIAPEEIDKAVQSLLDTKSKRP